MQIDAANKIGLNLYSPLSVARQNAKRGVSDASGAAAAERTVLSQERSLKARVPGATTHTTYTYAIGPDGRQYITGAEVQIVGTEEELAGTGGKGSPAGQQMRPAKPGEQRVDGNQLAQLAQGGARSKRGVGGSQELSPEAKAQIEKLKQTEREVIAHEAAHMMAGGAFAGAASYTYTTGPDGKKYITGGQVPISAPSGGTPEEALANALQVLRAATAPGDPSGQDMSVAASAAQMAAQARIEMATGAGEESSGAQTVGGDDPTGFDALRASQAKNAYGATQSSKGMWTKSGGLVAEEAFSLIRSQEDKQTAPFEIAA